ncbi:hypothetical protein ACFYRN_41025 [Streptomyces sp. NPDC005227]|uniref:hypothetical protein n=1 Tax=unclassified Streptomyces TaxID=2593676 RepID=UPI0036A9EBCB
MSGTHKVRRTAVARTLVATLVLAAALAGCTQSPAKHSARLTKAAGLARVTLVCPKDLWEETKPVSYENRVQATTSKITGGPQSGRGLIRVTMTGTNLVSYLKELDADAHPSVLGGERDNTAAARRVYNAIAPKIDLIKAATSPDDPEPEIVIDDTIPEQN